MKLEIWWGWALRVVGLILALAARRPGSTAMNQLTQRLMLCHSSDDRGQQGVQAALCCDDDSASDAIHCHDMFMPASYQLTSGQCVGLRQITNKTMI